MLMLDAELLELLELTRSLVLDAGPSLLGQDFGLYYFFTFRLISILAQAR
ncbi:hypothetical protein O9993_18405 [Vibrio lentus]|nr:hypothetical protein [Vibrio lentus]